MDLRRATQALIPTDLHLSNFYYTRFLQNVNTFSYILPNRHQLHLIHAQTGRPTNNFVHFSS